MIYPFIGKSPIFDESNWIAPSADVIGDVTLGHLSSIWFNATVRGDVHYIKIGAESNIQDNAVIHVTNQVSPTNIGNQVTIGHSAIIHGCTLRDRILVGMGAIIMDDADIGEDCIIGAKTLITARTKIPPRSMVLGAPAKVIRELTDEEVETILKFSQNYVKYSAIYIAGAKEALR
jgi:gamma-carbonic anhydrase